MGSARSVPRNTTMIGAWLYSRIGRWSKRRSNAEDLPRQRRLLVDISVLARDDAHTGIQRVVRAVLAELTRFPPDGFVVCPVVASRRMSYRFLAFGAAQSDFSGQWRALPIVRACQGDVFLGLDYSAHIIPARRRDLRRWQRLGVKLAFVVYDILPMLNPEWFSKKAVINHGRWLRFVSRNADGLVCISHAVAADMARQLVGIGRTEAPQITTIRLGADIPGSEPSRGLSDEAAALVQAMKIRPAVIMVGTIEPRKGYDLAIDAFEHLWASDMSPPHSQSEPRAMLVVVGRPGWKTDALQQRLRRHPQAGRLLHWFEDASDELLESLYPASAGLLFASRGEGFGLPLIEAARHGRPILARDLPVLREIAPSWTRFFAGEDPSVLAAEVARWLEKPFENGRPAAAEAFVSWAECATDMRAAIAALEI